MTGKNLVNDKMGIIIILRGFPVPRQWYQPWFVTADLKKCDQQLENLDLSRKKPRPS